MVAQYRGPTDYKKSYIVESVSSFGQKWLFPLTAHATRRAHCQ